MRVPNDMQPGSIFIMKDGEAKIVEYRNNLIVDIIFTNTGCKRTCSSGNIRKGTVKDLLIPRVFGVGYFGVGPHKAKDRNGVTSAYRVWSGMLQRCYYDKVRHKVPTYDGVTVCDEWKNFQTFAEWFYKNHKEGLHIDKDIKIDGNKVYSPDACIFVTREENTEKAWAKNYRFISPNGNVVDIYNLAKFCRENKLDKSYMRRVNSGKLKSYKGWTAAK